ELRLGQRRAPLDVDGSREIEQFGLRVRLEIAVDLAAVQSLRGVLGGRRRDLADALGGRDPLVGVLRLLFGVRSQFLRLAMRLFGGGAGSLRGLVGQLPGFVKALPRLRYELACALLRD